MNNLTYNGWTNYATWRVNLEIFDNLNLEEYFDSEPDLPTVAAFAKSWTEEILESDAPCSTIAHNYALAFLSDVNWREIAIHLLADSTFSSQED
jgi:hypothetical protein